MIVYTTKDAAGEQATLTPGVPFLTYDVDGDAIQHSADALELYDHEDLARFGIVKTEEPDPPPAPAAVPQEVERYKAKIALNAAGKLAAAEQAVQALGLPVTIYWNEAPTFHRANPLLMSIAGQLPLTDTQIDDLFRAAAQVS